MGEGRNVRWEDIVGQPLMSAARCGLSSDWCFDTTYDEILKGDKLSLDLFWIKDQSLTGLT